MRFNKPIPTTKGRSSYQPTKQYSVEPEQVVNTRLLVITLIAIGVLSPTIFLWHLFQTRRNAAAYLAQADAAEASEDFLKAAEQLQRYLQLKDSDEVQIRLATTFDRVATTLRDKVRAMQLYDAALLRAPNRKDLIGRCAELSLETRRYSKAEQRSSRLLELDEDSPTGWRVTALARDALVARGSGNYTPDDVAATLRVAIKYNPHDLSMSVRLASLYRYVLSSQAADLRYGEANAVIDQMVEANRDNAEALLVRFRYREKYDLPNRDNDLNRAIRLAPSDVEVRLVAGQRASQRGALDEAVRHWEKVIVLAPTDRRGYVVLGGALEQRKRYSRAIEVLQQGVELCAEGDFGLFMQLADVQLTARLPDQAEKTLEDLRDIIRQRVLYLRSSQGKELRLRLDYLQARCDALRRDYAKAIPALKRGLAVMESGTLSGDGHRLRIQAMDELRRVYHALGFWDLAAEAAESASKLQPNRSRPLLRAAEAWVKAGRHDKAIESLTRATGLEDVPATAWVALARARFNVQMQRPDDGRNWTSFERSLTKARAKVPNDPQLTMLEVDFAVSQGHVQRALDVLRIGRQTYPKSEPLALAWVKASMRWGAPEEVDNALEAYESQFPATAATLLLRSDAMASRGDTAAAAEVLRSGMSSLPPSQQALVVYRLAQVLLQQGDVKTARDQLAELADLSPGNVPLLRQLAELALRAGDREGAQKWETQLEQAEGPDGTLWRYFRARRLLQGTAEHSDSNLSAVAKLQSEILRLRPSWPDGHVLGALLAEREGRTNDAVTSLQTAVKLGAKRVSVYEQLIGLLYQQNRFDEADKSITRLRGLVSSSENLSWMAISVSARKGDVADAVKLAREGVQKRPNDAMSFVWLGQALMVDDNPKEAEQIFQQAVEKMPDDLRAWVGLLSFYVATGNEQDARRVMGKLGEDKHLSESDRLFTLGQGFEILRDLDQADANYRAALRAAPDDTVLHQRVASFFFGRDDALTEQILRAALKMSPDSRAVRRSLAQVLAAKGGEPAWQEAWSLVNEPHVSANADTAVDIRVRASLLIQHGGVTDRRRAIVTMKSLVEHSAGATREDRFLLARLYQANGELEHAQLELFELVNRGEPDSRYLVKYINLLLRLESFNDAGPWLDQLEDVDRDSFSTLALRVRWLNAQNREPEIEARVDKFVADRKTTDDRPAARARTAALIAQLYSAVGLQNEAEVWFRRLNDESPNGYQSYATWLAAQGRVGDAIDLLLDVSEADETPQVAATLAHLLFRGQVGQANSDEAEDLIQRVVSRNPDNAPLLFSVATLRFMQERSGEAIDLYRQIIDREPQHVSALNNLALLLAEQENTGDEALGYIDRAITTAGPRDDLQDTRGMVLLHTGKVDEAVALFRRLTKDVKESPVYHFHLAVACQRAGRLDDAKNALQQSRTRGLNRRLLSPTESDILTRLEKALVR